MRSKRVVLYAFVIAGLLTLGACAGEEPTEERLPMAAASSPRSEQSPSTPNESGNAGKRSVTIIDTDFKPVTLTVQIGTTVRWKQIGDQPHSVSSADGTFDSNPDCGPLDSDMCLSQGDTFSHTFDEAGEFIYYCRVHGLPDGTGMVGTIVVK